MSFPAVIKENDQVILRREKKLQVFQVKRKRQLFLDKFKFILDGIIGHPFGTTFELRDRQLVKIDVQVSKDADKEVDESCSGKDNRELMAGDSNQKLTQQDIEAMKEKGVAGQEIIQQLVQNSDTFKTKTEFSQAKYLKKKRKKHVFIVTVLKPTARLLIEMLYIKAPEKICNLRVDSLSQILCCGNVHAGINVAVVDSCRGLVVGSVLERMGGLGKIVQLYPGNDLNRYIVDYFDFPKQYKDMLFSFPLNKLNDLKSNSKPVIEQSCKSSSDAILTEPQTESNPVDTSHTKIDIQSSDSLDASHTNTKVESNIDTSHTNTKVESNIDTSHTNTKVESIIDASQTQTKVESNIDTSQTVDMDTGENLLSKSDENSEVTSNEATVQLNGNDSKLPVEPCIENMLEDKVKDCVKDLPSEITGTCADAHIKRGGKRLQKSNDERLEEQKQRAQQLETAKTILLERNIDCLIVASKHHPTPLVMNLLEFMAPARPVVVYSQYKEPLVDCYMVLKASGLALKLKLTETWFREYQVLPARTHPTMQMTGTGGYLLTFTLVEKR